MSGVVSQEQRCTALLDKIAALDPENPALLCARNGIDSALCKKASRQVQVSSYSLDTPYQGNSNLEAKIRQARNKPLVDSLRAQINAITFKRSTEKNIARERTLKTLYGKLLALTCVAYRVRLEPAPESQLTEAQEKARPKNSLLTDDELAFIESRSGAAPQPTTTLPQEQPEQYDQAVERYFFRTRLLPSPCEQYVEEALQEVPGYAPAICHKYGYYTPQCIEAKRAEKRKLALDSVEKNAPPSVPGQNTKEEPFARF
jgi:hypothetical protein